MKDLTIKGTSIEIISSWLQAIKSFIPEVDEKDKYKHIKLDPGAKNLLALVKSLFPGMITAEEEKDYCPITLLDDLSSIESLINPLLELAKEKP
jgi:hypothetical protein